MRREFWQSHFRLTAVALFALIALINYFPVLRGQVPFPRDLVLQHSAWEGLPRSSARQQVAQLIDIVAMFYPFRALAAQTPSKGALPLWNPYISSGAPFEANAQSALFSPFTVLYYVLPLKLAWTLSLLLRVFLSGLFMTLFMRAIGSSRTGAIFSGILFALCGFTMEWQGMSNGESGIWLPLIFYSLVRLKQEPDRRSIAIAAAAFAMPVLSGHPETAAHSTIAAAAMALFLWIRDIDRRFLICFVLAGLLALGLASVQTLPTLEWLSLLGPQLDNPQPVLDRHQGQGFFSRDIVRDPNSAGVSVPEGSAYAGMLGLLAASVAVFHRQRALVMFFVAMAIISTFVAFGFEPVRWIVVHIPVIKAMKNARLILLADFAIAAMAGLGISRLLQPIDSILRKRALIGLGIATFALCFCVYELHRATLVPVELLRGPIGSLLFLVLGLALLILRLTGYFDAAVFSVAVCGLCAVEMLTFSFGYLGFAPAREVFPPAPVLEFLKGQSDLNDYRVAKDRFPIPHDSGIIYGFEAADGYEVTTERTRLFMGDMIENRPDGVMFLAEKILEAADRRFDMLNVKYLLVTRPGPQFDQLQQRADRFLPIYSAGSVAVFENRFALPRVLTVPLSGVEFVPAESGQLDLIKQPAFDPQRSAVVSTAIPPLAASETAPAFHGEMQTVAKELNGYRFRTQTNQPALAVVSQMYYPGWKARINGKEAPVFPTDYALTGIFVPSGTAEVQLFFWPLSFQIGATISAISLAAIVILAFNYKSALRRE